ncbi:DsrE family protein [Thioflexithrix psekupsensis]|nr:DsrE family protein [Thioflexithrix psekupsensis]
MKVKHLAYLALTLSVMAFHMPSLADSTANPETNTATRTYDKQKVLYHINFDDPKQLNIAMRNIQNHINAVGQDNIEIKVIMHGAGINLLQQAKDNLDIQAQVVQLKSQNVAFKLCNNTLTLRQLDYGTDLFDVQPEDIVTSGVAELAYLQQQGYAYIKP